MVLRCEAAGMQHHQALRHRVDAEREDHRGNAQIGDAQAVDQAEDQPAGHAEGQCERLAGIAPPAARRGRHHAADRHHPGDRQIDMAQQNDQHGAGRR